VLQINRVQSANLEGCACCASGRAMLPATTRAGMGNPPGGRAFRKRLCWTLPISTGIIQGADPKRPL